MFGIAEREASLAGHHNQRVRINVVAVELHHVKSATGGNGGILLGLNQKMIGKAFAAFTPGVHQIRHLHDALCFAAELRDRHDSVGRFAGAIGRGRVIAAGCEDEQRERTGKK